MSQPLFEKQLHKVYIVPYPQDQVNLSRVESLISNLTLSGLFLFSFISPLLMVESNRENLSARNRDLNPLGMKRNIRQHFGVNSRKFTIKGYVTSIGNEAIQFGNISLGFNQVGSLNSTKAITTLKLDLFRVFVLYQVKLLIFTNTTFDIITIDDMDVYETEDDPEVYEVDLRVTSLRRYDRYNSWTEQFATGTIMNNAFQALLTAGEIVFT
jgi:hypothetical protein